MSVITLVPISAHAQFSLTGLERQLTLTLTPEYPDAGEVVNLSVSSFGMDLARSSISWYENGKPFAQGAGRTEATLVSGALGSVTRIDVIATEESGIVGSARAVIQPTEVDLIWSADSYVPPFYEGRRLPGSSSVIRAQALVRFKKPNGTYVSDADIIYSWYKGSQRILSGRGKSGATFPGPTLFEREEIVVLAESVDGTYRGRAAAQIQSVDPTLELYENHPLFGILFHRAFVGSVLTLESEQLVTAVPYSAGARSSRDTDFIYSWKVNGKDIQANPERIDTLLITANGYTGPAAIEASLTSARDWFLGAKKSWELVFSDTTSIFGSNPFGNPSQ